MQGVPCWWRNHAMHQGKPRHTDRPSLAYLPFGSRNKK